MERETGCSGCGNIWKAAVKPTGCGHTGREEETLQSFSSGPSRQPQVLPSEPAPIEPGQLSSPAGVSMIEARCCAGPENGADWCFVIPMSVRGVPKAVNAGGVMASVHFRNATWTLTFG